MQDFISGARYLMHGFQLLSVPGLRRFVVIPLLINIVLFIAMFMALNYWITQVNAWLMAFLPAWLAWLSYIVWLVMIIGFFFVVVFTFTTIANVIAAPFNSLLSEKVEWYLTGQTADGMSWRGIIKDVPRSIGRQAAVILYYIPRALFILLLYIIPIIQAIAAIISFLFHAWVMSLTYIDYPADNHRLPFKEMREWLSARRAVALGFGTTVLCLSVIPVINFIVMPAAVAGATKWWVDDHRA